MKFCRIVVLILVFLLMTIGTSQSSKLIWRSCLTGSAECLDALDGGDLVAGDGAFIYFNNGGVYEIYFYILIDYVSAPPDESSPDYITPNTNAGNKRWVLLRLNASALTITGSSGSIALSRTDNPACMYLYEATSDGNNYASLCGTAKGTGYSADFSTILPPISGYLSGYCTVTWAAASGTRILTTAESHCSYFEVTSASGGVTLEVATPIPGKMYTVRNNSGQLLTFKVTGGTGGTIANGHYAVYTSHTTDVIEIWEQTP